MLPAAKPVNTPTGNSLAGYARIAVALPVRALFTYAIPTHLRANLQLGLAVAVPFGGRTVTGYVIEALPTPDLEPDKIRPIIGLRDPRPVFDRVQLRFFRWMADYYRSGLGEVIATALPSAFKARSHAVLHATEAGVDALADGVVNDRAPNTGPGDRALAEVLREIIARPGLSRRGLSRRLRDLMEPELTERALEALRRRDWVRTEQTISGGNAGTTKVVRLVVAPGQLLERIPRAGRRQREVVAALAAAGGGLDLSKMVAEWGPYTRTAVRKLIDAGVTVEEFREIRDPVTAGELPEEKAPPTLTAPQRSAVENICGPPRAWLLHGVTGAGKTEVYLRAAAQILERGRQVLVLVPEIGLTPLLTGRFRARFGDAIAVLHSGLTGAQRLREWRRIRAGEASVAVGARSALFAPFRDLGMIVVDEEHDDSYKQEDGVRYNARDLAVVRGLHAGCPVVLGSATPSMETYQNALDDRYGLIELLTRPTPRPVPEVELVDLNAVERVDGRVPLLSPVVERALRSCFDRGEKAIVLYNRRGYATYVQCTDCGGSYACPSCGVGLVLHLRQRTLTCHYCGFHRPYQRTCPACQSSNLELLGQGTEQVEKVLEDTFPDIPIGRMDADTTAVRGSHHRLLSAFRDGETRLLVGTQIVAKGHDFPDVTVAAVIGADHVLMMPDFRAAERTYALLTQLAGRAGRGEVAGRVLVQTHHTDHYVFRLLGDYRAFHAEEARQRKLLNYPPFARLVLVRIESSDREAALKAALALTRRLRQSLRGRKRPPAQVLGPVPAALPRLVGRWRFQVLLRGPRGSAFRRWFEGSDLTVSRAKGVRVVVDVDPRHLM